MMFNIPYVVQCSITTLKSFIQYDVQYSFCIIFTKESVIN